MVAHNIIVVDFNNLFTGRQNFVTTDEPRGLLQSLGKKSSFEKKLDFAFGGVDALRAEIPGLTVIPIMDHMRGGPGRRFHKLCKLPISNQQKLYMVPKSEKDRGAADHFVLALAEKLDAYTLSRDRYSAERRMGLVVKSERAVVPIYIEERARWMFVMGNGYRAMLRSPEYKELIRAARIRLDGNESYEYDSVLVKGLRSEYSDSFVDLLEEVEKFSDAVSPDLCADSSDQEVRERAFNYYLPKIESDFVAQFSIEVRTKPGPEPLADRVSIGLGVEGQLLEVESPSDGRNLVPTDVSELTQSPFRKRAEPHFKIYGEEINELHRRLGRRVVVTALIRIDGDKATLGWLDRSVNIPLRNFRSSLEIPSPSFVEIRGRVCETDGELAIDLDEPMQFRLIGIDEMVKLGLPRMKRPTVRVPWVLPRFPWSGRFNSVPFAPQALLSMNEEGLVTEERFATIEVNAEEPPTTIWDPVFETQSVDVGVADVERLASSHSETPAQEELKLSSGKSKQIVVRGLKMNSLSGYAYRLMPTIFWVTLVVVVLVAILR